MQYTEDINDEKTVHGEGIAWRRLPVAALLAAVAAAVANVLVYFAASALGLIPENVLIPTRRAGSHR